jgi:pantoate--beta-alanine ligase
MTEWTRSLHDFKKRLQAYRNAGERIGFVPTMGALHQGHLTLAQESKREQDRTVMSIFVNPLQFGPGEDLDKYPRRLEQDYALCQQAGVDLLWTGELEEMYPKGYQTYVDVEQLTRTLCGSRRPGHFRGVTTVVCKLFHLVQPTCAYFGKKDAQQCLVIRKMVQDLNMDLQLKFVETVREPDGLALSSRNQYLGEEERRQAIALKRALDAALRSIQQGERESAKIREIMKAEIDHYPLAKIDYIQIVDQESLQLVDHLHGSVLIALAVFFGSTRLIDNLWITH